jgi:hypothetical protein
MRTPPVRKDRPRREGRQAAAVSRVRSPDPTRMGLTARRSRGRIRWRSHNSAIPGSPEEVHHYSRNKYPVLQSSHYAADAQAELERTRPVSISHPCASEHPCSHRKHYETDQLPNDREPTVVVTHEKRNLRCQDRDHEAHAHHHRPLETSKCTHGDSSTPHSLHSVGRLPPTIREGLMNVESPFADCGERVQRGRGSGR